MEFSSLRRGEGLVVEVPDPRGSSGGPLRVSSAGDVNGDGVDDVIVGWSTASTADDRLVGQSYVIFGSPNGYPTPLDVESLDGTNGFIISGRWRFDTCGKSVSSAGDVNGDGFADLIIGAPGADAGGRENAGEIYLIFGTDEAFASPLELLGGPDGTSVVFIYGVRADDEAGQSVSSLGDVNADGIDDFIIGTHRENPALDEDYGLSYVVFGRDTDEDGNFPPILELSELDGTEGFVIRGVDVPGGVSRLPVVSSAGDVNGDGVDDILVGARSAAHPTSGVNAVGNVYVVFGRTEAFPAEFLLSSLDGLNGFTMTGRRAAELAGAGVSAADIDGDGFSDVLIGAVSARRPNGARTGGAYVVLGRSMTQGFPAILELDSLDGTQGFPVYGIDFEDSCGNAIASAGDVSGDGIADFLVSAPAADPSAVAHAGETYVVFGSSELPDALDLSTMTGRTGFAINGYVTGDASGDTVSSAGDFNGDGIDDMIIGGFNARECYILYGQEELYPGFRFVVLADSRGDKLSLCSSDVDKCVNKDALQRVLTSVRALDPAPDFTVFTGDMIMGRRSGAEVLLELDKWIEIVDGVMPTDPQGRGYTNTSLFPVFGGHERNTLGGDYPAPWSAFDKAFFDSSIDDRTIARTYMDLQNWGHTVYYFDVQNARFFVLNNDCVPDASGGDAYGCVGHEFGQTQFDWVRNHLRGNGKDTNFLFHHEPIYGTGAHDTTIYRDKRYLVTPTSTMDNKKQKRNAYTELLGEEDNNVRIVFSGHEHNYTTRLINKEFVNLGINFPTELLIEAGDTWRYLPGTTAPPNSWNQRSFDHSSWATGQTGIGYGDDDDETVLSGMRNSYLVLFTRREFTISDLSNVKQVDLRLTYDDGCVVYVNGTEVGRVNMPEGAVDETTRASSTVEPVTVDLLIPFETLREGSNLLAVSVHNRSLTSSDLSFIPVLSLRQGEELTFDGEFREVKTGSSGAPWRERSYEDYMEGLEEELIEIVPPWTGDAATESFPYHYAVVDVYKKKATFDVFAVTPPAAGDGQAAQIVEDSNRVRVGGSISYSELVDANADGDTDSIAITAPTGAGEVGVNLPEDPQTRLVLSHPESTTDTALGLDRQKKPERRFPYGLVGEKILGVPEGETVTLTVDFPEAVAEDGEYYGIGSTWEALAYQDVDGSGTITVSVTDGGPADRDGQADGVITHLGALTAPLGKILPGDCNSDTFLDISDPVCMLDYLFVGVGDLPCGDGTLRTEGNRVLLDFNARSFLGDASTGETEVDLSDVVSFLHFLFLGGPPHALGRQCVPIRACPANCAS